MRWLSVLLLALLTACGASITPTPEISPTVTEPPMLTSAWGEIITLGESTGLDSPALAADSTAFAVAWVDSGDIRVEKRSHDGTFTASTTIEAPADAYHVRLFAAPNGHYHLIWLDALREGAPRLYAALLDSDLQVILGADSITDHTVIRYAANPSPDGGMLLVWTSANVPAEPELYLQEIDPLGRPRLPTRLIGDADFPALLRSQNGEVSLFWIRPNAWEIHRAILADNRLNADQIIGHIRDLSPYESLSAFRVARDDMQIHAFIMIHDARTQLSRTVYDSSSSWVTETSTPDLLRFALRDPVQLAIPYNAGYLREIVPQGDIAAQAAPLDAHRSVLPVAAFQQNALLIVFLRGGAMIAGERLLELETPFASTPAVYEDRDAHLYITWVTDGQAYLITSRGFIYSEN